MSQFFYTNTSTSFEAALDYASKNIPVFPSSFMFSDNIDKPSGPKTLCPLGYQAATTDQNTIKSWWDSFPDALISVPTGSASGLLVFSINSISGGEEKWEAFAAENGLNLEESCCQKTPFGREYIFKMPVVEGKTPAGGELFPGVKVVGEGGSFVIAPGAYSIDLGEGKKEEGGYAVVYNAEPGELTPQAVEKVLALGTAEEKNKKLKEVVQNKKEDEEYRERLKKITGKNLLSGKLEGEEEEEEELQEEEEGKYAEKLPRLPMEALPPRLGRLISGVSSVFCVDEWLPFAAALKVASTAVGANILLEHRQSSPGHTWLCLVGAPSLGKSEITRFFGKPIAEAERVYCEKYAVEFTAYMEELKEWEAAQAAARKNNEKFKEKKPEPPTKTTLYVDDVTPESLALALSHNPGGISWDCDEIRALLSSFGRYGGKGSGEAAKARMLSMYSGSPLKIDRKGAEASTFIPAAWLSIFGTVQPSILPRIFEKDDRASGFLQRFMFIKAEATPPVPTSQRPQLRAFESEVADIFGGLVKSVQRLVPVRPGAEQDELRERTKPRILRLDQGGEEALDSFVDTIKKKTFYLSGQGEEAEEAQSRAGRWCDQLPRLILLLHCLHAAEEGNEPSRTIEKKIVENAITVFKALMAHSVFSWENIKGTSKKEAPRLELLEVIDKYIKKSGKMSEIHYAETTTAGQKIADAILEELGAVSAEMKTKQALSKSLLALGFEKGKTMAGQKYFIKTECYEKALAELAGKNAHQKTEKMETKEDIYKEIQSIF